MTVKNNVLNPLKNNFHASQPNISSAGMTFFALFSRFQCFHVSSCRMDRSKTWRSHKRNDVEATQAARLLRRSIWADKKATPCWRNVEQTTPSRANL